MLHSFLCKDERGESSQDRAVHVKERQDLRSSRGRFDFVDQLINVHGVQATKAWLLSGKMATSSFFRSDDGLWFVPLDATRGPWDADACHAGPPTGLIARAAERAVPQMRLARLTVEFPRPIPMEGFTVDAEVVRETRSTAVTSVRIVDKDGTERANARAMHLLGPPSEAYDSADGTGTPRLADAQPGPFPIRATAHQLDGFTTSVDVKYPPGHGPGPGPTAIWMRTLPLLADEEPSGAQRICALADCGNATSRLEDPHDVAFINTDLTISLHRSPVGEWMGSSAVSFWQPDGTGQSDALLFDEVGAVGRALQTLLIRRLGG